MTQASATSNNTTKTRNKFCVMLLLLGCMLFSNFLSYNAHAADVEVCTMKREPIYKLKADGTFELDVNNQKIPVLDNGNPTYKTVENTDFKPTNTTLITDIILKIKLKLSLISIQIYSMTVFNLGYIGTIQALMTLYVTIYGLLFMTGMVNVTVYDFVIRIIKLGVVTLLLTPTSIFLFNDTVVKFFEQGTDSIINFVTSPNATTPNFNFGGAPDAVKIFTDKAGHVISGISPFTALDNAVGKVISSKMFVTILATFVAKDYGPLYFILLLIAIWSFMKSLMTATWVYVMSLVMKTLLLGLAPIFIPTILFQKTRHLFDNWINQLVSASLQPILLFIFFIFFVKLAEGSLDNIMHAEICFNKLPDGMRGSPFNLSFWQFMKHTANGFEPNLDGIQLSKDFPIDMIALLTFFIIAEISNRFNSVVLQIASSIGKSSINLSGIDGLIQSATHATRSGFGKMFEDKKTPTST